MQGDRDRVLDAAKRCCERWGVAKVTVDDIAAESGVSRATLYRLFPGGRDVLYEALRVRETEEFMATLTEHVAGATTFEDVVVRGVVGATRMLQTDEHLKLMLASEPGEVASDLTVAGLPRIFRVATVFLTPFFAPYIGREQSARLAEWLARVVISYFLAPSRYVDLADEISATEFVRAFVLPAFEPSSIPIGR
ncbi:MAG TPA: TetR/AcrR family transcriptional regulator [Acidimicrobiales bacterium]